MAGAHFSWRAPIRPFRLEADLVGAGPFKTLAGRRYPVFHGLAVAENVEQYILLAVNDDGAGLNDARDVPSLSASRETVGNPALIPRRIRFQRRFAWTTLCVHWSGMFNQSMSARRTPAEAGREGGGSCCIHLL